MPRHASIQRLLLIGAMLLGAVVSPGVEAAAQAPGAMEQYLLAKINAEPMDASHWRSLGRCRLKRRDTVGALEACSRAVELDPLNASAQFDLAHAHLAAEQPGNAMFCLERVMQLAPNSDYGRDARQLLSTLQSSITVAADRQPNRFAGDPKVDLLAPPTTQRLSALVDVGIQYNSNVQLAPLSRVVVETGQSSWQAFVGPQLNYQLWKGEAWRSGVGFAGYFHWNDADLRQYNLQDYRPNVYLEHSSWGSASERITKFDYTFTLDAFRGTTFGRRHAATASMEWLREQSDSFIYWSTDYANFSDDGDTPTVTSLDGWTHTLGASHTHRMQGRMQRSAGNAILDAVRVGADLQYAPLLGDDFAYHGVYLYAEARRQLFGNSLLTAQVGWGRRNYPDFTGTPPRDETLWHGSLEWSKWIHDQWKLTGFATLDQFHSRHPDYDTARHVFGVMTTFRR